MTDLAKLTFEAEGGNAEAQYEMGKKAYDKEDYDKAEEYWENAARNGHEEAKIKLKKLYANELKDKYNSSTRIPYSASRTTRGGNAPSGSWSKWNRLT